MHHKNEKNVNIKDVIWKVFTIIFIAVNIPSVNNFILKHYDPGDINAGTDFFIQANNSKKLQSFYVNVDGIHKDKFTFIRKNDPGFDRIVEVVEQKYKKTNSQGSLITPDVILNEQTRDEGDPSNVFTTERIVRYAKLKDDKNTAIDLKTYEISEFRALFSDIKPIAKEQLLIEWIREYKGGLLIAPLQVGLFFFLLIIIVVPNSVWREIFYEAWGKSLDIKF